MVSEQGSKEAAVVDAEEALRKTIVESDRGARLLRGADSDRADAVLAAVGETLVRSDIFGGEAIGNSGTSRRIKLDGCSRSTGAAVHMELARSGPGYSCAFS